MTTKKLRNKILDLAIHGGLVKQDPNDEPASALLARIRAEKEQLVKEGKLKKKDLVTTPVSDEDKPFEVPEGWEWCRIQDICYVAAGSTPSKECFVDEGIPYLKMYNLRNNLIDFEFQPQYVKEETHNGKLHRSRTQVGDIIMNIVGPPLGKVALIPSTLPQANFNQAAVLIRPLLYKEIIAKYIRYYLLEMSEINSISTKGSAGQDNISLTQSQQMRFPLPPLAEQQRIVAAVEQWMSLIDVIESGQENLQQSIALAKNKILDLAIKGKLVPQDANDEPASVLLEHIRKEKEQLVKEGKLKKKDLVTTPVSDEDKPFEVPEGWEWTNIGNVLINRDAERVPLSSAVRKKQDNRIFDYYGATGVVDKVDSYLFDERLMLIGEDGANLLSRSKNNAFFAEGKYWVNNHAHILDCIDKKVLDYIAMVINSMSLEKYVTGSAQPKLNQDNLNKIPIPLPPLSEQQRIVAKIEELFALLDNIANALK